MTLKISFDSQRSRAWKNEVCSYFGLETASSTLNQRLFLESYSLRDILMYFKIIVRIYVSTFCLSQTDAIIFQCRAAPNADQALEICEALVEQHDHPLLITNDSRHSGKQGISS